MVLFLLSKIEATQPFTENEAWGLFRIAAIAEALGWSLLISGITIHHYQLPGSSIAIPIAGQIHGILFLAYFGILIAVYSSISWSRKKILIAALMGVIPLGTLAFEQWVARSRRNKLSQEFINRVALNVIADQV